LPRYIAHGLVSAHGAWLVAGAAALMIVMIGATAVIVLVALAPREHRVDAIRAAAEVLSALLPWPGQGRSHLPDQ
jgi:hypothetical protein